MATPEEKLVETVDKLVDVVTRPGGLLQRIEELCGLTASLQGKVQQVQDFVGRAVFPADAMNELTAELRAVRYLLDDNHKFRNIDVQRAKKAKKT